MRTSLFAHHMWWSVSRQAQSASRGGASSGDSAQTEAGKSILDAIKGGADVTSARVQVLSPSAPVAAVPGMFAFPVSVGSVTDATQHSND